MDHGTDIQDWVDAGFTVSEAKEWSQSVWGRSLPRLIMSQIRGAGYSLELHGVPSESFKDSGFNLRDSMTLIAAGFNSESFRDSGFNLHDSMALVAAGFNNELGDYPKSMRFFRGLGLTTSEVIELRSEIEVAKPDIILRFNPVRPGQKLELALWSMVRSSLEEIYSVGLPLNLSNLKLYFGLSAEKILSIIDLGLDADLAVKAIDYGFSDEELPMVERLLGLGLSTYAASVLLRRKIRVKDISRIKSQKISPWSLTTLLVKVPLMSVEVGLIWLEAGFSGQEAADWLRAGVDDIEIAIRRKTAGIRPPA